MSWHPRERLRGMTPRSVGYWATTAIISLELLAGAEWDITRVPYVLDLVKTQLGYPEYFLVIIGIWKVAGGLAILYPRYPRLTEWAYAGAFFTYSGAVASHVAVGAGADVWLGPAVFAVIEATSWLLWPSVRGTGQLEASANLGRTARAQPRPDPL